MGTLHSRTLQTELNNRGGYKTILVSRQVIPLGQHIRLYYGNFENKENQPVICPEGEEVLDCDHAVEHWKRSGMRW
jgi:hypothetical protein